MKIEVKLEVDLSIDEIALLRKYFENNEQRVMNVGLLRAHQKTEVKNTEVKNIESLITKDILIIDYMMNTKLTSIGLLVVNQISRNDLINKIIN